MSVTDDRMLPLASVRLYEAGQGDPLVLDHGFGWYDVLKESAATGTYGRDAQGQPLLEYLPGVGLVCRPFLNLADTRKSHYSTLGGTWEEQRPATGSPRAYRLCQIDTTAGLQWSATSLFSLPASPSVAFTLLFADSPPDWDTAAYPQYVRLELGREWALEFRPGTGGALLRKIDGAYQAVLELPNPVGSLDESLIFLRCLRGKIGVSCDFGRSYAWLESLDGSAISMPAGRLTLRGQGGQAVFGLHPLRYYAGTYDSPTRSTFTSRVAATPALAPRATVPGGTGVALSDRSDSFNGIAQWRATLTPAASGSFPFAFYTTPELYTVTFRYPVTTALATGLGAYTTPWDGELRSVEVDKPLELDTATASVRIRKDAATQLVWRSGRWPKVQIRLGEAAADGSERWWTVFTGYIRTIEASASGYGEAEIAWTADNVSIRLKRAEWTRLDAVPLGGQTLNEALDQVLASEGLNASYRSWHEIGDRFLLPYGRAEEPFEWPRAGERKWETLQRLAGYAGLEVVPADDGTLLSGPKRWAEPWLRGGWEAVPATDLKALVQDVRYCLDSAEAATAVLVDGQGPGGEALLAWAVDGAAEGNLLSERLCPWRETVQETLPGTATPGMLLARVQALAGEQFSLKLEPELTAPVNLDVARRDRVRVAGTTVGIADTDEFVVLSLRHHYEADPSFGRLTTTAGLRIIPNFQ
jgi:hypothetical protein